MFPKIRYTNIQTYTNLTNIGRGTVFFPHAACLSVSILQPRKNLKNLKKMFNWLAATREQTSCRPVWHFCLTTVYLSSKFADFLAVPFQRFRFHLHSFRPSCLVWQTLDVNHALVTTAMGVKAGCPRRELDNWVSGIIGCEQGLMRRVQISGRSHRPLNEQIFRGGEVFIPLSSGFVNSNATSFPFFL